MSDLTLDLNGAVMGMAPTDKSPDAVKRRGFAYMRSLAVTYSGMATATLPSAQSIFTSEFEMGSGGSCSL